MKKIVLLAAVLICSFFFAFGQEDLSTPFKDCNIKGSTTIYDYQAKKWISSDIEDSHKGTLPASTFKIINTLIALETAVVKNENEIINWPGATDTIKYGYRPDIYHDMSMKEAFKTSAGWVYVELAKKIGKKKYRQYLEASNYGNASLSINDDDFWNFGGLAISPANHIAILIGVYKETLPFKKTSFQILKDMMVEEQTADYTLRAKTGWTREGGKDTGWWVGYLERGDNVYFFATRLIKNRADKNSDFGACRKEITKTILRQLKML